MTTTLKITSIYTGKYLDSQIDPVALVAYFNATYARQAAVGGTYQRQVEMRSWAKRCSRHTGRTWEAHVAEAAATFN